MRENGRKISTTKENVIYFYQIFTYHFISFNFFFLLSFYGWQECSDLSIFFMFFVVVILWSWKIINPVFPLFFYLFFIIHCDVVSLLFCLLHCKITTMIKARSVKDQKVCLVKLNERKRLFIEKKGTKF